MTVANTNRTFGEGPYPFSLDHMEDVFEVYESDTTIILDPKPPVRFDLYPGSHHHTDYEFLIPYSSMEHVGVEAKRYRLEPKQMLPINSDQPHGPNDAMINVRFLSVSLEKSFFEQVYESLSPSGEAILSNNNLIFTEEIETLLQLFMQESRAKQMGYALILKCLSTQIAISIIRQSCKVACSYFPKGALPDAHVKRAIEMLQDSYNLDHTLEDLAKVANLSPYHFIRVFKLQTGKTPFAFLLDIKLERAREMLRDYRFSITEVCYASGFKGVSHFSTVFKKKYGVTPSEYRLKV